MGEKKFK